MNLIRIRLEPNSLLPEYFLHCLSSQTGRYVIEDRARTTAGQYNLNLGILGSFPVPVAPLSEQHEIVRRVQALFALTDAIETRVDAATARASKLKQAILTRAFRGELVPTEAELARREGRSYEPASELLARIRAEREAREAEAKTGRRARRRKRDKRASEGASGRKPGRRRRPKGRKAR
jgi:type I restriction enzyme S subunit